MSDDLSKREVWIDTARGIAILLVVLGHIFPMEHKANQIIYSFHVPIFFIISGMLLSINYDKWICMSFKDIAIKKFKEYMYPYLIFSIISITTSFVSFVKADAFDILKGTITLEGYLALWFLPTLLFSELLFVFVVKKIRNVKFRVLIVFGIIIMATYVIKAFFGVIYGYTTIEIIKECVITLNNEITRFLIASVFIFFGFYFNKLFSRFVSSDLYKKISIKVLIFCVLLFIDVILLFFKNSVDLHYSVIGNPILYYSKAVFLSIFVIYACKLFDIETKYNILAFWGKNSLIIFVTHLNLGISQMMKFMFVGGLFIKFILVMVIETIIIFIINKWLKWLVNYKELTLTIGKIKNKCIGDR